MATAAKLPTGILLLLGPVCRFDSWRALPSWIVSLALYFYEVGRLLYDRMLLLPELMLL